MYYTNTACTGVHMLTHDYTVCCSGTWYLQNDQPPLYQQYFIENFCLPVLIFGLVFQVSINTLTLTLYYRFLITNSHFKTFFDCISSNHCIRYLKSFKNFVTDILVVSQLDVLISAVKKTKKTINSFNKQKSIINYFCSYLIFFAFHVKNTRNF